MLTSSHHAFVRVGVCVCSGRFLYWTSTINQVTSEKHLLQLRELCVYNDWLSSAGVTAAQLDDTLGVSSTATAAGTSAYATIAQIDEKLGLTATVNSGQ